MDIVFLQLFHGIFTLFVLKYPICSRTRQISNGKPGIKGVEMALALRAGFRCEEICFKQNILIHNYLIVPAAGTIGFNGGSKSLLSASQTGELAGRQVFSFLEHVF